MQHLQIHDVGDVEALVGYLYLLPDELCYLSLTHEHGYHRRGIEDYQ